MEKQKPNKRGPKYPVNVGKRKILNIAINYLDGIPENELIEEIQEKLGFSSRRGIKGHLGDLGPGRVVKGEWIDGAEYLIKIPSKYDSRNEKEKLIGKLTAQGIKLDIDALPETNIWKPNTSSKMFSYIFVTMMKRDFKSAYYEHMGGSKRDNEHELSFFNTKYVQSAIESDFLPVFKKRYEISAIEGKLPEGVIKFIELGFKLSPTAVSFTLLGGADVDVATGLMLFALSPHLNKGIDNPSVGIATLYSCLLIDLLKYCSCSGIEDKLTAFLNDSDPALSDFFGRDLSYLKRCPMISKWTR